MPATQEAVNKGVVIKGIYCTALRMSHHDLKSAVTSLILSWPAESRADTNIHHLFQKFLTMALLISWPENSD